MRCRWRQPRALAALNRPLPHSPLALAFRLRLLDPLQVLEVAPDLRRLPSCAHVQRTLVRVLGRVRQRGVSTRWCDLVGRRGSRPRHAQRFGDPLVFGTDGSEVWTKVFIQTKEYESCIVDVSRGPQKGGESLIGGMATSKTIYVSHSKEDS